jgi:hypothetical protein
MSLTRYLRPLGYSECERFYPEGAEYFAVPVNPIENFYLDRHAQRLGLLRKPYESDAHLRDRLLRLVKNEIDDPILTAEETVIQYELDHPRLIEARFESWEKWFTGVLPPRTEPDLCTCCCAYKSHLLGCFCTSGDCSNCNGDLCAGSLSTRKRT